VGWARLELATNALKGRCSTIELPTPVKREGGTNAPVRSDQVRIAFLPYNPLFHPSSMSAHLSPKLIRRTITFLVVALLGLGAWLGWKWWLKPWLFPPSPLVVTPKLALEALQAKNLYFNGLALPWLVQFRPEFLTPEDRDRASSRSRSFLQATQNPKLFRQLDRQTRFDTILLLDDPSNYQRLLDHLLEPEPTKRDFKLVYLDHWALVFKRDAEREWLPPDAEPLKQKIAGVSSEDRAAFLAKSAARMLAVRQSEPAKLWLDEAIAADSGSVDALAGLAAYYVALGKWPEAESYADRALEKREDFIPALQAKVVAMRGTGHHIDALKLSKKLNMLLPEDPVRLWQHAQLAHDARDYDTEITSLERLIELAKTEERPSGDYEFRLGEAHVFQAMNDAAHAPKAIAHLRNALRDPSLPPDKRRFAEERIATIRQRTGLK
jgi:tetratricopeptide (TPR) repeat protein